ncbi:hypothetical protein SLEP1_g31139 [Rubroshorea leprosula]|uniref:DUF4408 domain-containing protein n=1 Tax=Rubroshorea leprosula TaxID=152421 RepID=A0AAV5KAF3_9ROSI|nr:hypothetical protein SLEP1_g31139 [Rubroshorea leprosula]
MDSFDIKLEKRNAILKHRRRCKIANLLRLLEVCVVLIFISRLTIQFPAAVKNSGGYFRDLKVTLESPRFIFIVGNLIVIILFTNSGKFSSQDDTGKSSETDFYEEFLEKSEKSQAATLNYETEYREKQRKTEGTEHREKQKKQVRFKENTNTRAHRRSWSQNLRPVSSNKACHQVLRRSKMEKNQKLNDFSENSCPEDNMSSEEFRNIIEAFIERQKQFRKDEECSVLE